MAKTFNPDYAICCQHCATYECLDAAWVPQGELEKLKNIWREQAAEIGNVGREPPLSEVVFFLQEIAPRRLAKFFRENCQSR